MTKEFIKTFIETLGVGVAVILVMWFIGYVPPNPRIFNAVDKITFTHFFENRIYDNWIMIAFLFAIGVAVFDAISFKSKDD
ncbi:hypothetical protein RNS32_12520 [Staphylococcus pseudintermedius]|uniref:hypothetical protein n=1 Tax=Staphylococcus intermedius group TaxID=2815305 RepID=UPI001122076D|nr:MULTISPECIES: hypothetical protein [Staphylococcus intermedius group]EGQ0294101.1 hypothetical protein [Staphylococcus pseudintermedius]EGQ0296532.1 hypothetical protein [Staphylococcus pseudintermedius]EGQ0377690.1 hypothetical protein [Staphylococcus pseudintermedius]EGQ1281307.1 hypothetical protein [Staphylococcus pseudintermedius]EGQ1307353.1 hypothetical protein [Staphylococcus pseudintermedius]